MKGFKNAIGIDVSKLTLDAYDYQNKSYQQFKNQKPGFKALINWVNKFNEDEVILCFEHTGLYSLPLAIFLSEEQLPFCMVAGLEVKRSMGIRRGKNDKADAMDISKYAFHRKGEIKTYQLPSKSLLKLKSLLGLRENMVKQKAGYLNSLKEMKRIFPETQNPVWFRSQKALIKKLTEQIKIVETEMNSIIQEDDQLKKLYELTTSIKGVGLILGISFIVYTNGFTAFNNWRAFASYSGTAPFSYRSGSSLKGKDKISHLANKRMKVLLSNAASSAILYNPEMKTYYQRRLKEGKSKMSTQNIIRNKIISRVFAVVHRGTPYIQLNRHAA
ncbi:MAG: IS110 family transposase [Bacteroidota bacterium]